MKKGFIVLLVLSVIISSSFKNNEVEKCSIPANDSIPSMLLGDFVDDYGIRYTITDSVWIQHPNVKYHILKWNTGEQSILAKNDVANPSEPGLYTRIDYMYFTGMKPWQWGFCLTVYNAKSDSIAVASTQADRQHPKKGCNGYPFSRMKKMQ